MEQILKEFFEKIGFTDINWEKHGFLIQAILVILGGLILLAILLSIIDALLPKHRRGGRSG